MKNLDCPIINVNDEVIKYVNKFNSDEELLRSGGLPTEILDELAFGFNSESIKSLMPNQLSIKWRDDLENVRYEINNLYKKTNSNNLKKTTLDWANAVNLSEPIDVSFEKNKFFIEDGHHRYFAAKILNKPLNVNLEIKQNPIIKLSPKLSYDNFHRCLFKQVKNNNLNELRKFINETITNILNNENNINDNFWKWFNGSKIVDDGGKPLIVYHGSNSDFNVFDISKVGKGSGNYGHYGFGFYFSDSINEASNYGSKIMKCYLKINNPFIGTDDEILQLKNAGVENIDDQINLNIDYNSFIGELSKIDPVGSELVKLMKEYGHERGWELFLNKFDISNVKNDINDIMDILEFTTYNKNVHGIPENIDELLNSIGININNLKINKGFDYNQPLHWITKLGEVSKSVTEVMIKLGYDGVVYGSEHIAFYPNQIKSINNDGTWDNNDLNILS